MVQCLGVLLTLTVLVFALLIMTRQVNVDDLAKLAGCALLCGIAVFGAICFGRLIFANFVIPTLHELSRLLALFAAAAFPILFMLATFAFLTDLVRHRGMNRDSNSNKRGEP